MVMPRCGTFDYAAVIPDPNDAGALECRAEQRLPVSSLGDELADSRLVGLAPSLSIADAESSPDHAPRSRVTLNAGSHERASVASASFHVDRMLVSFLRAGDVLYVSRSMCAGLGLSILREGQLIAAAGDITGVPLGNDVTARYPGALIDEAEAVFRRHDPKFAFDETPLELNVMGTRRLLSRGQMTAGPFNILVVHGFIRGFPGIELCASIARPPLCSPAAINVTANLLADPLAFTMRQW